MLIKTKGLFVLFLRSMFLLDGWNKLKYYIPVTHLFLCGKSGIKRHSGRAKNSTWFGGKIERFFF